MFPRFTQYAPDNIQAIVVRPGLTLKSKMDETILVRYLARAGGQEEIDKLQPENYGPELCRMIAKVRPELDAYLVTERSVEDIAGLDLGSAVGSFTTKKTLWSCI